MELWELFAREAIRDTIARYNLFGDTGRFDAMVEQFAPDGTLELVDTSETITGHPALRAFFAGVAERFAAEDADDRGAPQLGARPHLRHSVSNVTIDLVSTTEATSRAYFQVITAAGLDHWGRYRDRLVPVGDRWLLAHRSVRTDGWATDSRFRPA